MKKSSRNNIIISADDFGIRQAAKAILPLAQAGKLDRVSVLIHYVQSKEEVRALLDTNVHIDLHLELIDILKSGEKEYESALFRGVNFCVRYMFGMIRNKDVEASWRSQIERFKDVFGKYPDGLNSHEHVHYFPRFFRIALELGEEYHIPSIRFAHKGILEKQSSITSRILAVLWKKDRVLYAKREHCRETSDFFVSFDWINDMDTFLQHLPQGKTEIVFHPERSNECDALVRLAEK